VTFTYCRFGRAELPASPTHDDPALGEDPQRNNDFNYANDPRGKQAPLGCHMRRMNPRDTEMAQLTDVKLHRIIRRSTTYGTPYDPTAISERDDEVARGIYFIFLSARAMETIEFLQKEWINNGNFMNPIWGEPNRRRTPAQAGHSRRAAHGRQVPVRRTGPETRVSGRESQRH
jgi:deferrochelatase/peroxidase EfeB